MGMVRAGIPEVGFSTGTLKVRGETGGTEMAGNLKAGRGGITVVDGTLKPGSLGMEMVGWGKGGRLSPGTLNGCRGGREN